ncbi:hypothetical protein [Pseudolactococcus chungangensis]|jgi:hypothetical protein|uniref:hypothetical protein n=1 Tax=Pseudolactococcus chungangensis TaxID=451457 RepID=UPI0028D8FDD4|nr:hypothetical protein [Lactococcus chungangensis]
MANKNRDKRSGKFVRVSDGKNTPYDYNHHSGRGKGTNNSGCLIIIILGGVIPLITYLL